MFFYCICMFAGFIGIDDLSDVHINIDQHATRTIRTRPEDQFLLDNYNKGNDNDSTIIT